MLLLELLATLAMGGKVETLGTFAILWGSRGNAPAWGVAVIVRGAGRAASVAIGLEPDAGHGLKGARLGRLFFRLGAKGESFAGRHFVRGRGGGGEREST